MGRADCLKLGSWNVCCDLCGRKRKGDELLKTWNGLWVCAEHWEPRHPQDFVRAVKENPTPPFIRKCLGIRLGDRNPLDIGVGRLVLNGAGAPQVLIEEPPGADRLLILVSGLEAQVYDYTVMRPKWSHSAVIGDEFDDIPHGFPRWIGEKFVHSRTSFFTGTGGSNRAQIRTVVPQEAAVSSYLQLKYSGSRQEYVYFNYLSNPTTANFETYYSNVGITCDWYVYKSSDGVSWTENQVVWNGYAPNGASRGINNFVCATIPVLIGDTLWRVVTDNSTTTLKYSLDGGVYWDDGPLVSGGSGVTNTTGTMGHAYGNSAIISSSIRVWTTTDAGSTWRYTTFFSTLDSSIDVAANGDTFVVLTDQGMLQVSINGGLSWTRYSFPSYLGVPADFIALTFDGTNFCAADKSNSVDTQYLWFSSDGITWNASPDRRWSGAIPTVGGTTEFSCLIYTGVEGA